MVELSQKRLKEVLSYNKSTGIFTRLLNSGKAKKGTIENKLSPQGYVLISIGNKQYRAHRLAFLYVNNKWPDQTDHINHIRNDNRWLNIRDTNHKSNSMNRPLQSNNKSGTVGVHWDTERCKWHAQIKVNGKSTSLGRFDSKKDAINKRKAASVEHNYHINHGGIK